VVSFVSWLSGIFLFLSPFTQARSSLFHSPSPRVTLANAHPSFHARPDRAGSSKEKEIPNHVLHLSEIETQEEEKINS
jgi:hypothetical protein